MSAKNDKDLQSMIDQTAQEDGRRIQAMVELAATSKARATATR